MKILIVEDELNVASFLSRGLTEAGHQTAVAHSGEEGLQLAKDDQFDALILDLILPGIDGLEVCRQYREVNGFQTPILMLTALGSTENVVSGLQTGADDYLVKPFKFTELLARLEALSRRAAQKPVENVLRVADLEVNLISRLVRRGDTPIRLTAREYELLAFLMQNAGRVVSREAILANVWKMDWDVETNVVDVYINYLRNKVDKPYDPRIIKTVVGMGYIITEDSIG
jgi:DNA-binding response OmpR family regulator